MLIDLIKSNVTAMPTAPPTPPWGRWQWSQSAGLMSAWLLLFAQQLLLSAHHFRRYNLYLRNHCHTEQVQVKMTYLRGMVHTGDDVGCLMYLLTLYWANNTIIANKQFRGQNLSFEVNGCLADQQIPFLRYPKIHHERKSVDPTWAS
jgi:hypothetical protein